MNITMTIWKIKQSKLFRLLFGLIGNVLIVVMLFYLITMSIPYFFGLQQFTVLSDSMGKTIPYGSLVYVKAAKFGDVKADDIATFRSSKDPKKHFTHRIVSVDVKTMSFVTKGDAGIHNDPLPIDASRLVGKVATIIPFAGFPAAFFNNKSMLVIAALLISSWIATEAELFIKQKRKKGEPG